MGKIMKAFPNPHRTDETGMTLRDYFAGLAMQGIMASGNLPKSVKDDQLAAVAYDLADAMLKSREQ